MMSRFICGTVRARKPIATVVRKSASTTGADTANATVKRSPKTFSIIASVRSESGSAPTGIVAKLRASAASSILCPPIPR